MNAKRGKTMKLKAVAFALALLAGGVQAEVQIAPVQETKPVTPAPVYSIPTDGVRYAPVVRIEPIRHNQSMPQTVHVCTPINVPIYRNVYRPNGDAMQAVSTLIGAAVGASMVKGDNKWAGGLVGAAAGAAIGKPMHPHPYHGVPEVIGYEQRQQCTMQVSSYDYPVIIGYNVTYDDNGVLKTIVMTNHPGPHIRLITTTRIQ
jgi:uncharacterized protein YcfJ